MIHARSRFRSQGGPSPFNTGRFAGWLPDPTAQPAPADGPANDATSSWIRNMSGTISVILPVRPRLIRLAGWTQWVQVNGRDKRILRAANDQWTSWFPLPWGDGPNEVRIGEWHDTALRMVRVEFQ